VASSVLTISSGAIRGAVPSEVLRQVLLMPNSTLDEFSLRPGDLRENIVIDDSSIGPLHALPSGSVLRLGGVRIRLTVHCEPCKLVAELASPTALRHKRGYLGTFLQDGTIHVGDKIVNEGVQFDPIPYELRDRIVWYLEKQTGPVEVTRFVRDIGLSLAACRAVPNMIKGIPGAEDMILFKNRSNGPLKSVAGSKLSSEAIS